MNYYSRFLIVKERLFNNTKKLLTIYHNSITLENLDNTEKEIINFEDITSIEFEKKKEKEFKITYLTQPINTSLLNKKKVEVSITYNCSYRINLLSDLLTNIDLSSKINAYPIETYQCYLSFNVIGNNLEGGFNINKNKISYVYIERKGTNPNLNTIKLYDVNINLYRTIFLWILLNSKKEMRMNYYEIESMKKINFYNIKGLLLSTSNKTKMLVIPKSQDELEMIKDRIYENTKDFLGYKIKYSIDENYLTNYSYDDEIDNSFNSISSYPNQTFTYRKSSPVIENMLKNNQSSPIISNDIPKTSKLPIKSQLLFDGLGVIRNLSFSFNGINKILYSDLKMEISLRGDVNFLYEYSKNNKLLSKIPYSSILYVIIYETIDNFFELILRGNNRLIFETIHNEKNKILSYIIEALSINKSTGDFLVLPIKSKFGKRIYGFPNDIPDYDYEYHLLNSFIKTSSVETRRNIIEDMALNMCFKNDNLQRGESLFNNEEITIQLTEEIKRCRNDIINRKDDSKLTSDLYKFNLLIIVLRNIGENMFYQKNNLVKEILFDIVQNNILTNNINFFSVFYNVFSIYKNLLKKNEFSIINKTGKKQKKEEQKRKNEIITFLNASFFKKLLYERIYQRKKGNESNELILNFETINMLYISEILSLEIHILDVSTDLPIFQNNISELSTFESLFLFYRILLCSSNLLQQKAIQIMLMIMKRFLIEQEYHLKTVILSRTLIFFVVLLIYLTNKIDIDLHNLCLTFLKEMLISHVECTNLISYIFPLTLFYHIEDKPKPINWLGHEWGEFFETITKDYSQIKLIWNQNCRDELIDNLQNLIKNYEQFTDNNNVVSSFRENFASDNYNNDKEQVMNYSFSNNGHKYNNSINVENVSHFSLNYKEFRIEYNCLKKEIFVWQYYLKKIINEKGTPSLSCRIDQPKKFWKKLKKEIIGKTSEHHIILILKTMILLYKTYYESIGDFKEYDFFIKFYLSVNSFEIKCYILQLFLSSILLSEKEFKEKNIKELIDKKEVSCFINFIFEIIKNFKNEKSSLVFQIERYIQYEPCSFFIDNKTHILSDNNELLYDEKFPNYTDYITKDDISWKESSKEMKTITIAIIFYKVLLKRNPVLITENEDGETDFKITFPLPKMKAVFCEEKNFSVIVSLLLFQNENLTQEVLDLFLFYLNDPLTYFSVGNKFCLIDVFFILMIKYKSKNLMSQIDKIYNYQKTFFDVDFIQMTNEEIEFFKSYPSSNKLLLRYFPINIIYFYTTHDFEEFINLIYSSEEIKYCDLIWNRKMLNDMLNSIRNQIVSSNYLFDKNFRCNYYYKLREEEGGCYLYYINLLDDITKVNSDHYESLIKILNTEKNLQNQNFVKVFYKILKHYSLILDENIKLDIFKNTIKKFKYMINDIEEEEEEIEEEEEKENIKINDILKEDDKIIDDKKLIDDEKTEEEKIIDDIKNEENKTIIEKKNIEEHGKIIEKEDKINEIDKEKKRDIIEFENMNNLNLPLLLFYIKILILLESKSENNKLEHTFTKGIHYLLTNSIINEYSEKGITEMIDFIITKNYFEDLDLLKKICIEISKLLLEKVKSNSKFIKSSLIFIHKITETENGVSLLIKTAIPFQLLIICTNFDGLTNDNLMEKENNIYLLSFKILKEFYRKDELFRNELQHLLGNKELISTFSLTNENGFGFLNLLVTEHKNPIFIWNSKLLNELRDFLLKLVKNVKDDYTISHEIINEFKYKTYEKELRINNVYLSIYNINPTFKLKNENAFLEELIKNFLSRKDQSELKEIIFSIANCLEFGKADPEILTKNSFDDILDKFIDFAFECTKNNIQNNNLPSSLFVCINFINVISMYDNTIDYITNNNLIFCFINLIEKETNKHSLEKVNQILLALNKKIPLEKINLAIFLFLLKKLISLKDDSKTNNSKSLSEIEKTRKNLLSTINQYSNSTSNNNHIGIALRSLYEFYLPPKIIDNLFHSASNNKGINEISLQKWLDGEIELPDLIWNKDAFNSSYKLLEDDCNYILSDRVNIADFPNNLLNHKSNKGLFFEIFDEYKVDNIYLRLFNKDPNYNIGRNLLNFLINVLEEVTYKIEEFSAFCVVENNDNMKNFVEKKLITSLCTIMLLIEQINFNDFNTNLGIANSREISTVLSVDEEYQTNLLPLIQRSFEYQNLLSESITKKILMFQKVIYNKDNKLIIFNMNIRIIYLQILYLICLNKFRASLIADKFEKGIIDFILDKKDNISDYEIILLCSIINRLFFRDLSYISIFLTTYLNNFVILAKERPNLKKYISLLLIHIINDSQYGESLQNTIKLNEKDYEIFGNDLQSKYHNFENEISPIWRKSPEFSDQASSIFKYSNMNTHYLEDKDILKKGLNEKFISIFPIIPKNAINYYNYSIFKQNEIDNCVENITNEKSDNQELSFVIDIGKKISQINIEEEGGENIEIKNNGNNNGNNSDSDENNLSFKSEGEK